MFNRSYRTILDPNKWQSYWVPELPTLRNKDQDAANQLARLVVGSVVDNQPPQRSRSRSQQVLVATGKRHNRVRDSLDRGAFAGRITVGPRESQTVTGSALFETTKHGARLEMSLDGKTSSVEWRRNRFNGNLQPAEAKYDHLVIVAPGNNIELLRHVALVSADFARMATGVRTGQLAVREIIPVEPAVLPPSDAVPPMPSSLVAR